MTEDRIELLRRKYGFTGTSAHRAHIAELPRHLQQMGPDWNENEREIAELWGIPVPSLEARTVALSFLWRNYSDSRKSLELAHELDMFHANLS